MGEADAAKKYVQHVAVRLHALVNGRVLVILVVLPRRDRAQVPAERLRTSIINEMGVLKKYPGFETCFVLKHISNCVLAPF